MTESSAAILRDLARRAAMQCKADDALIFRAMDDELRLVARHGSSRTGLHVDDTVRLGAGLAVLREHRLHVRDLAARRRFEQAGWAALGREHGVRTLLSLPMVREGVAVGVLIVGRP